MSASFPRIKNFNVTVKEIDGRVIFTRKLEQGGSNHSFGIHVAQMAGMPNKVVLRASEILEDLEEKHAEETFSQQESKPKGRGVKKRREGDIQMSIFQLDDPTLVNIKEQLKGLDINSLTPVEALVKLSEIKKSIGLKD